MEVKYDISKEESSSNMTNENQSQHPAPPPQYQLYPPIHGQPSPSYGQPVTVVPGNTMGSVVMAPGAMVVPGAMVGNMVIILPAEPTVMQCRSCNEQITTRVEFTPSLRTHIAALGFCLLGCWPCVCIPYCMDSCKNPNHYCPRCGAFNGSRGF